MLGFNGESASEQFSLKFHHKNENNLSYLSVKNEFSRSLVSQSFILSL